jgi:heterodisulfide reductase subunit A
MAKKNPDFNYKTCMACSICAASCAFGALRMNNIAVDHYKKAYPQLIGASCTGCGLCAKACPLGCITMMEIAAEKA